MAPFFGQHVQSARTVARERLLLYAHTFRTSRELRIPFQRASTAAQIDLNSIQRRRRRRCRRRGRRQPSPHLNASKT